MALPIGLICGFASPLLSIWIGQKFLNLFPLMWLLIGHLCINLTVLPIFAVQIALKKVKIPGIVSILMGICNLSLAILFPLIFGWGMYGVAAAGAIVLTLKNAIFTPLYGARILKSSWYTFMRPIFPGIIATIAIAISSFCIAYNINPSSWTDLIICFGVISLIYASMIFFVVLRNDEKFFLLSLIPTKVHNRKCLR